MASEIVERVYLDVPYHEKDDAKNLGARWDPAQKKWYVLSHQHVEQLERWMSETKKEHCCVTSPSPFQALLSSYRSKKKHQSIQHRKAKYPSSILNFWRTIEFFSPQLIPKTDPTLKQDPVYEIKQNAILCPWEKEHPFSSRKHSEQLVPYYTVYCAVYALSTIKESVDILFGKDQNSFDERLDGDSCVFAFSISADGRPLFDTFILSQCAWALSEFLQDKGKESNGLEDFDKTASAIGHEFATYCKINESDKRGMALKKQGINIGKPLTGHELLNVVNRLLKKMQLDDAVNTVIRVKSGLTSKIRAHKVDDQDFLNSFYTDDLKLVSKACAAGNSGWALNDYLSSDSNLLKQKKVDVRKEVKYIFDVLAPHHVPFGRWPSVEHHPLVLSQQVAINAIFRQFKQFKQNDAGIFAVNGPPGTGKTTLLRDLIAEVVVKRAICLSKFENPKSVFFKKSVFWNTAKHKREISPWPQEFEHFSIVVASSNNAAVENITYEIPGETAVDSSWVSFVDYFKDFSEALIHKPAWALMAARLGNKSNRMSFVQDFWYGSSIINANEMTGELIIEKNDEPVSSAESSENQKQQETQPLLEQQTLSFLQFLKSQKDSPPMIQKKWRKALSSFVKAQQKEEKIRNERASWYALLNHIDELTQLEKNLQSKIEKTNAQLQSIEKRYSFIGEQVSAASAQVKTLTQQRLNHHQFRPKLIDIIFSLGKAHKDWTLQDNAYVNDINEAKENLLLLEKKHNTIFTQLRAHQKHQDSFVNEIRSTQFQLQEHSDRIVMLRQKHSCIPDIQEWLRSDKKKELTSPWADEAWNKARSMLFLEALNLHKSFILANAPIFIANLRALMDILDGTVPHDAPADATKAAWLSLFFVIPVISTTFASFDRLFKHLSKEDIGWLLVDEAGQATPQSAVGAIWRSKKVVVVGDPLQLKPIVALPFIAQQALRHHFLVSETWLPQWTSVQMLADRVTSIGTFLPQQDKKLWVGAPLRVHRRCDNPMFQIVNTIAYDDLMVFGTSKRTPQSLPESCWFDVSSTIAEGHFIPEEGRQLHRVLQMLEHHECNPQEIFIISPFKQVVSALYRYKMMYPKLGIGTIHTTQGKEADIVILVLGGNPSRTGAKKWASESPNMLNVAISRAKRRLYVIGDFDSWKTFNYFDVMSNHLPIVRDL